MRLVYTFFYYLFLPLILLRLFWKGREFPDYRTRWQERFACSLPNLSSSIWLHTVSLGEAIAATPLIREIKKRYPHIDIVVTTTTATGSQRILQAFHKHEVHHFYVPYDIPIVIKKFLNHINPSLVIIMETELWPNILYHCTKRHIPILLANARLSTNSFLGYKKLSRFMRQMLNHITLIAAQSEMDAKRYIALGADPSHVEIFGNIKFDITVSQEIMTKGVKLRNNWGNNRSIWIAASTHEGEEKQVLLAWHEIKNSIPDLLLVLVPRHPERFSKVTELCKQHGLATISYLKEEACLPTTDVVIGDTTGELPAFYAASDVVFVGGSLVDFGGHNLLEPAALALPIITGPYLSNFQEISKLLVAANAVIYVKNHQELKTAVIKLFNNKNLRLTQGKAGLQVIEHHKGALTKLIQWVDSHLPKNIV
jgi:3-deoxy-D-manno-octulosonic-acid transferase